MGTSIPRTTQALATGLTSVAVAGALIPTPIARADNDEFYDFSLRTFVCLLTEQGVEGLAKTFERPAKEVTASALGEATGAVCPNVYDSAQQHVMAFFGWSESRTGTSVSNRLNLDVGKCWLESNCSQRVREWKQELKRGDDFVQRTCEEIPAACSTAGRS
jgi:hypothetical protein